MAAVAAFVAKIVAAAVILEFSAPFNIFPKSACFSSRKRMLALSSYLLNYFSSTIYESMQETFVGLPLQLKNDCVKESKIQHVFFKGDSKTTLPITAVSHRQDGLVKQFLAFKF